jgi:hypothetical protein
VKITEINLPIPIQIYLYFKLLVGLWWPFETESYASGVISVAAVFVSHARRLRLQTRWPRLKWVPRFSKLRMSLEFTRPLREILTNEELLKTGGRRNNL